MNFALLKRAPLMIFLGVASVVVCVEILNAWGGVFPLIERLELVTYDWRACAALRLRPASTSEIGVAYIDDQSLGVLNERVNANWPIPRWLHGVMLDEITAQGAAATGYDIFFLRLHPGEISLENKLPSDPLFAEAIERNGHVFLGAPPDPAAGRSGVIMPAQIFAAAACGFGDARKDSDADGVFRRVRPVIRDPRYGDVWQLGFRMAAETRGWLLDEAKFTAWQLTIPDKDGHVHTVPLDGKGNLMINWRLPSSDRSIAPRSFVQLLGASAHRRRLPDDGANWWKGRLVFVGSFGKSPSLSDRGSTPIDKDTFYCSTHWNVVASVLDERFIHPLTLPWRLAVMLSLMTAVAWLSWRLRAIWATWAALLVGAAYVAVCAWSFAAQGWWLPIALPLIGSVGVTHGLMAFFRVVIERVHRRRLRSAFEKLVAPRLLDLVLDLPGASWASKEKSMTVFFADIRGFTALTDQAQVDSLGLTPIPAGDATRRPVVSVDQRALEAVNLYLSLVVDTIREHGATLDKYIGDCVMAFWGAPLENPEHAAAAIRAAIEVQRRIDELNKERMRRNRIIEAENKTRVEAGHTPAPLLPILTLGTGINTGRMTVGFMGSESHPSNYTVFGREVNIAARLESLSASGHIFVSKATLDAAVATDSALASMARPLGGLVMKGIGERKRQKIGCLRQGVDQARDHEPETSRRCGSIWVLAA